MAGTGFRVDVAYGTRELRKIGWIDVAIRALRPLPLVFATVNGEILSVVRCKLGRHPIGVGGVTADTIGRKLCTDVVGRLCARKIRLMAGVAGIGRIGKVAAFMALPAICNIVSFGQREKIVADITTAPIGRKHIVAFQAVGRITGLLVVGLGGSLIILQMTTDAVIADPVELQVLGGSMALLATYRLVYARERKPILNV